MCWGLKECGGKISHPSLTFYIERLKGQIHSLIILKIIHGIFHVFTEQGI
jgi:hypothetical protein